MLWHLFPRCPVLPVDASVSLTAYSSLLSTTLADAAALEREATDAARERAALLHIRALQLVCKTLPAHPEAALPEAAPLRAQLVRKVEPAFARLEAYAAQLARAAPSPPPARSPLAPPPMPAAMVPAGGDEAEAAGEEEAEAAGADVDAQPRGRGARRSWVIGETLLALFERGAETVAVLAGRVGEDDVARVTAMVVPSQRAATLAVAGADAPGDAEAEAEVLYLSDIVSLLAAKGLVHLGWLRLVSTPPGGGMLRLGAQAERLQRSCQAAIPEMVTGVVHKRGAADARLEVSWVRFEGAAAALAPHVVVAGGEDAPPFKLYDLRPMAAVHEAKARAAATAAEDPPPEVTEPDD